jgi:hypothetical protein
VVGILEVDHQVGDEVEVDGPRREGTVEPGHHLGRRPRRAARRHVVDVGVVREHLIVQVPEAAVDHARVAGHEVADGDAVGHVRVGADVGHRVLPDLVDGGRARYRRVRQLAADRRARG